MSSTFLINNLSVFKKTWYVNSDIYFYSKIWYFCSNNIIKSKQSERDYEYIFLVRMMRATLHNLYQIQRDLLIFSPDSITMERRPILGDKKIQDLKSERVISTYNKFWLYSIDLGKFNLRSEVDTQRKIHLNLLPTQRFLFTVVSCVHI